MLAHAIPSIYMDNTSELATVLPMNQSLVGFGIVDAYAQLCPSIDVCEPATTIDSAWTTINSSWQELDMYQFDATHLAWSLGRLGLHSRFIVAPASNGTTIQEDLSSVKLGFTFELLYLPPFCVHPRPEVADPNFIEATRVVTIKWKKYQRLRADLYNPRTQNNCLF
eukprot:6454919-Amphidinium_carterae.1